MTYEQTKTKLEQQRDYYFLQGKIEADIDELVTIYQHLTANIGNDKIQSSNIDSVVEQTIIKIQAERKKYAAQWQVIFAERDYIKSLLYELPSAEGNIIEEYYLKGKTYRQIACKMNYEFSWVYRKSVSGIRKLSKILN